MLPITVKIPEQWYEETNEFIEESEHVLRLEHSLVSLSKWEAKWHKHYINNKDLSTEEMLDYIRFMNITQNVSSNIFNFLSTENLKEINEYITNPMTATTFSKDSQGGRPSRDIITSEVLYAQMVELGIPFECEKWHLNRLITLIRVCAIRQQPPKKMSKEDIMNRNRALNASRRQRLHTKG